MTIAVSDPGKTTDSSQRLEGCSKRTAHPKDQVAPIALYVHWPYCARICPYCDFNVHKARPVDKGAWIRAFKGELAHWRDLSGPRELVSIYFGGGTPSLCPPEILSTVIETAYNHWPTRNHVEITLEANPTDAEQSTFDALASVGINRLSLGVQSFDNSQLKFLGRNHDGASARRAVDTALSIFKNVSFDMIYALPGETTKEWQARIRDALSMGTDHLSAYQLTVEPGTAFERAVSRKAWTPTDDDTTADLFDITQEETCRAGLDAYEISNHARTGARSRHNLAYWRGEDYAGVGPGAHGRLSRAGGRLATETIREPSTFLDQAQRVGHGLSVQSPLSEEEVLTERLAMGLRSAEGLMMTDEEYQMIASKIDPFIDHQLCKLDGRRLVATRDGRRVLNALIAEILNECL